MTVRDFKIFLLILAILYSCSNLTNSKSNTTNIVSTAQNNKVSKLLKFQYGGYDDTVVALIYGNVYQENTLTNSKDSLQPLSNVSIKVEQNSKAVSTDSTGHFQIGLEKGTFNLLISKPGYQSLRLTNYISDPDQISNTIIILEKGSELQIAEISK